MIKKILKMVMVMFIIFAIFAMPLEIVWADQRSVSGNWVDWTVFCGGGACAPFFTNHTATAVVNFYYVSGGIRITYWQTVVGNLWPGSSPDACGNYQWLFLKPATYTTLTGTINIQGWYRTGSNCGPGSVCDGFRSENDYSLTCGTGSCTGTFNVASYFTTRCIPTSRSRTLNIGF